MAHTILHEWEERDKKARKKKKGKRKDRKPTVGEPVPAQGGFDPFGRARAGGWTGHVPGEGPRKGERTAPRREKGLEELETVMAAPIPGSEKPPWNTDRTGKRIPRVAKKGGRVRGYSLGGKIRGAGKVKKGVRKAKMVKMKG